MTQSPAGPTPAHGGHFARKSAVLFLCVHNAGRSQMAMGFFQYLAGDRATAFSGP
jgi:arsenate reductase (thioredoxin)